MSLLVEVAGFGICQGPEPYSVYVICVQQENFQAWTVYRRHAQFANLAEQLREIYPNIPALPDADPNNFQVENLEATRVAMNRWIQIACT